MTRRTGGNRIRAALFLGVGLGLTGLVLVAFAARMLQPQELDTIDARFAIRGTVEPPRKVAVIGIDGETITSLGRRGVAAFDRRWHAQVIDRLRKEGARAILYDVQFTEQSDSIEADNALIEAAMRARGKIVFAATDTNDKGESNVFGGAVRDIGARDGSALISEDRDGTTRRVNYQVGGLESFGLVGAELASGRKISPGSLPEDPAWIDFLGPPGTVPEYSFLNVLRGKVAPGTFKDVVVVVGPTAATEHDFHTTSTGQLMAGPELQANVAATALRGFPRKSVPEWFDVLLIGFMGLLVPIAALRMSLRMTLVFAIAIGALYVVTTQLAFNAGWVTSFIYPFLALLLTTVGSLGAYYILSIFERQRVHDVFARFVPETVVDEVLAQTGDGSRLGAVEVTGTVMFTDIRGFTSFSEGFAAPEVIAVLNRYLAEMSDAILGHGGTLASFLGDGFMAVFGAPIEQSDHADQALAAAREIVEVRLPRFNAELAADGYAEFKSGIGLNSGPFMSGNVGSEQRLQYTAIGDTINTASRIEGLTKDAGFTLLLADSTRLALQAEVADLVYVDEFEVRGRQGKVKLWSLAGARSDASAGQDEQALVDSARRG